MRGERREARQLDKRSGLYNSKTLDSLGADEADGGFKVAVAGAHAAVSGVRGQRDADLRREEAEMSASASCQEQLRPPVPAHPRGADAEDGPVEAIVVRLGVSLVPAVQDAVFCLLRRTVRLLSHQILTCCRRG